MASGEVFKLPMRGGHECGAFFYAQLSEFKRKLADELPVSEYTPEEEEAGFRRISEAFGFYGTLDKVARYLGCSDKEALRLTVNEFYTKLKYLAWMADAQKQYREILNKKKD